MTPDSTEAAKPRTSSSRRPSVPGQDAEVVVERVEANEVHLVPRLVRSSRSRRASDRSKVASWARMKSNAALEDAEFAELVEDEGADGHQPHEAFDQRHRSRLDARSAQRVVLDDVA